MAIYLGNLTIEDFQKRLGIEFSPEDLNELKSMRQEDASNIQPGKIHIFDIPFFVRCGDMDTARRLLKILNQFDTSKFPRLEIGV